MLSQKEVKLESNLEDRVVIRYIDIPFTNILKLSFKAAFAVLIVWVTFFFAGVGIILLLAKLGL